MKIESGEFSYKGIGIEISKLYLHKGAVVKVIRFDDFYEQPLLVEIQGARKSGRWINPFELKEMIDDNGKLIVGVSQ